MTDPTRDRPPPKELDAATDRNERTTPPEAGPAAGTRPGLTGEAAEAMDRATAAVGQDDGKR